MAVSMHLMEHASKMSISPRATSPNLAKRAATKGGSFRRRYVCIQILLIPLFAAFQYTNDAFVRDFVKTIIKNATVAEDSDSWDDLERGAPSEPLTMDNAWVPTEQITQRRLLIAQYAADATSQHSAASSNITYETFLSFTSRVNQAYAIAWHCDYLILRGTMDPNIPWNETFQIERLVVRGKRLSSTFHRRSPAKRDKRAKRQTPSLPASRATYNKLAILDLALSERQYDSLLILDADAMLFDFSRDITTLLPPDMLPSGAAFTTAPNVSTGSSSRAKRGALLVAHKTNRTDVPATGSINVGVTLWNLRHPLTPALLDRWKLMCELRMWSGRGDDDQAPLQSILKKDLDATKRERVVYAISKEFAYDNGLFVKHFIRPARSAWNVSERTQQYRLTKMQQAAEEVCSRYSSVCNLLNL
jgi:hypothetical protein